MKNTTLFLAALVTTVALTACSDQATPASKTAAANSNAAAEINAPAGRYKLDPNHASVSFMVNHVGLSNYVAWFTDFDIAVDLDPADLAASSVTASINPFSITTDYSGDFKATHKDSPYSSWEEDLARSPKFFNADEHPKISFTSNKVEATGKTTAKIHGDLSLLGQTHPVVLDAQVVGSVAKHPFTGVGAIGFSAVGHFKRSDFGMNHLLQPLLIGDQVTVRFEGEFQQIQETAE
jgi:polyisoprenoid-binding protein YceI